MEHRAVDVILDEWRAAERELEANREPEANQDADLAREALQARILQLRDEHRAALAARAAGVENSDRGAPHRSSDLHVVVRER